MKQELLPQLRSKMSHDLRSKINVIQGYSEFIREALTDAGQVAAIEDVAVIERACDELLLVDEEIRDLVTQESRTAPLSIDTLVEEIRTRHADFSVDLSTDVEFPNFVKCALCSILRKAALVYATRCQVAITVSSGESALTIELDVGDAAALPVTSFFDRFVSKADMTARLDFDAFYIQSLAHADDASLLISRDEVGGSSLDLRW